MELVPSTTSLLFDLAIFRSAGLRGAALRASLDAFALCFACASDDDDGYAASYYFALYSAAFSIGVLCRATSNRAFVVADLVWFAALIPQRLFMYADDRSSAFGVPLALVLALIDISNGIQKVGRGVGRACRPPEGDVEGGAEVYACTSCELLLGVLAGAEGRENEIGRGEVQRVRNRARRICGRANTISSAEPPKVG